MSYSADRACPITGASDPLPFMTPQLVHRLETALSSVGAYGEVRLVVLKGRVRFIEVMRSESIGRRAEAEEYEE
jgi:hypothetical protein